MDSRPRNNQGQFAPDEQGGMDPNTTSAAYNPQIIEARKASLAEKLRRAIGLRRGVEESVPQEQRVLSRFNHGGHGEHGGGEMKEMSSLSETLKAVKKVPTKRENSIFAAFRGQAHSDRVEVARLPSGVNVPSYSPLFTGLHEHAHIGHAKLGQAANLAEKIAQERYANSKVLGQLATSAPSHVEAFRAWANKQMKAGYRNYGYVEAGGPGLPMSKKKQLLRDNPHLRAKNVNMSAKLRLRELARQAAYDPYAVQAQPAEPGQAGRDFRNAALGIGALGAGGGVAYAGFRGAQAARSAQTLTDDALKTSGEARKAARTARVAAARFNRAGKVIKTQLTTFPTFKKVASKIFEGDLKNLKELAARSVELSS